MNLFNATPVTEALCLLGWENLETQRAKAKAKEMYKIVNGLAPQCLTDLFISKNDISHYKLRGSSNSLQLPLPKTEFARVEQNCGTRFLLHFDGESDTL